MKRRIVFIKYYSLLAILLCLTVSVSAQRHRKKAMASPAAPAATVSLSAAPAASAAPATTAAPATPAAPQLTDQQLQDLQVTISDYMQEVIDITSSIKNSDPQQLKQLRLNLQGIDARWQLFNTLEQNDIASSDALMDLMAQYKEVYLATDDSITAELNRYDAVAKFNSALAYIDKSYVSYEQLQTDAERYSYVAQTAPQLESVKAQEQLLLQQVTARYNQAVAAAGVVPSLKTKLSALSQKYISIQEMSKSIQAAAYKPLLQRIKDYLMSFAAVAIIIMFLTMLGSRIAAAKKARDMAKKYGKMPNGQQDDIPTI